ncbi:MAG TPA: glycosyltransferase family 39 protein, partial [Candidatus Binatia bacterium]|nr:glycosyltransferase family 39 protein [Candidatus Binatia bacterium]
MSAEEADIIARQEAQAIAAAEKAQPQSDLIRRTLTLQHVAVAGLLIVLLLGATFRFTGINWDENHHLHPDERFLTDVANRLQPVTDPLSYLRTSESTLNPYNLGNVPLYVYGNFPMTVLVYVADWVNQFCQTTGLSCAYDYAGYDGIHILGRVLSGLTDLLSIVFIFLIGRRLYDWRAGLLGALLLSLAVMPIQQSHFFTMDNWAAALSTVALYMAVRASESAPKRRWWILFGLFLGLAVASRINVAPLAAIAPVAGAVWLARREREAAPGAG